MKSDRGLRFAGPTGDVPAFGSKFRMTAVVVGKAEHAPGDYASKRGGDRGPRKRCGEE